ncbi:MAG: hypothetical protein WBA57_00650 [Elainellaceae cyanobacterium]
MKKPSAPPQSSFQRIVKRWLTRGVVLMTCVVLGLTVGHLWQGEASLAMEPTREPIANLSDGGSQTAGLGSTALISTALKVEGTVDPVPPQLQLGHELYLENCATCHVGLPPAVMPSQTWVDLLQDTQHYGVQIPRLVDPGRILIWQYLEYFSRPVNEDEATPYRVRNSRYFKALHPTVEFEEQVNLSSCVSCHPAAIDFNYRRLSSEWQDAP